MAEQTVEWRVDKLKYYMEGLSHQAMNTEMELARLSREMRDFGIDMMVFKNESRNERRQMNRQLGQLANRLGTLLEDIVAPDLPRIARELFGCGEFPDMFALRLQRRIDGKMREYDAVLACKGVLLVNETRNKLTEPGVDEFKQKLAEAEGVLPEARDRQVVGILASLYPSSEVIAYATKYKLLVMGMGDGGMAVRNPEALPKEANRQA